MSSADGSDVRVTLLCAPAPVGGLESAVAGLARGLARSGAAVQLVQLLTPGAPPPEAFATLESDGVQVHAVHGGARAYLAEARAVRAHLHAHGSHVLHSHGERADLVSLLVGGRQPARMSSVHGFVVNTLRARVAKEAHVRVLRRMDAVVAVSEPLVRELSDRIGKRALLLSNAIPDRELADRAAARQRLGRPEDGPVIGWVGRLSNEKRPLHFLEALALARLPEAHAVIVGDGPLLEQARARAEALGLADRVTITGAVAEAGALFRAFDLFVISSSTEGTPMTVLEAMRAGVPVVSTAVGGVPAMLADECGWLVPADSAAALAESLHAALRHPSERARRAARARAAIAQRYSHAAWIAGHLAAYRALSAGVADRRPATTLPT